jgi:hypothetical protein
LHDEASDPGVLGEHLYYGRVTQVALIPRQDREQQLFLFAEMGGSPFSPKLEEGHGSLLGRGCLFTGGHPSESPRLHQALMMVVRKVPEFYGALHAFTSFSVSGFYDSSQEAQTPWLTWVFALL